MEQMLTFLSTLTLILTASIVAAENTDAAEGSKAQAISGNSGGSGSVSSDKLRLVRRYVPRFVGKREPEDTEIDNVNVENSDKSTEEEVNSIDDYVQTLIEYYDDLSDLDTGNINEAGDPGTSENSETDEYQNQKSENEDILLKSQDEKRYVPSFVGKRYRTFNDGPDYTMSADKRYYPRFVGKRYHPMFVGKRYQPRFIGKRYTPRFVGKRYTPRFVGKRYTPRFVGKRYTPMFIGKRYTPKFIGKRYTPKFIGKKSAPTAPFLEQRFKPYFAGERDQDLINENSHIEKRSVAATNEELDEAQENTDRSIRRKRSLADTSEESLKRAWGTYIPLKTSVTRGYISSGSEPSYLEKRFVAPEFIGRRDSLSTILSALDALQYARNEPRSTSKRFEAPLFIGKRGYIRPRFIGKRNEAYTGEMKSANGYGYSNAMPGISEFSMNAYESVPDDFSPFIYPYSRQGSMDL